MMITSQASPPGEALLPNSQLVSAERAALNAENSGTQTCQMKSRTSALTQASTGLEQAVEEERTKNRA